MSGKPQKSIGEYSKVNLELFAQVAEQVGQSNKEVRDAKLMLADEIARFKLWTSNIGVFADVQLSLDFRIRELPDVKDLFTDHLNTIESGLLLIGKRFISMQRGDGQLPDIVEYEIESEHASEADSSVATTPSDATKFMKWTLAELLQSIHESIDWLHRLSNMVRKASFINQNRRAETFLLGESEEEHDDIIQRQEMWFRHLVKSTTEDMEPYLLNRVVQGMVTRYVRIMYRRSRRIRHNITQVKYHAKKQKALEVPQEEGSIKPLHAARMSKPMKTERRPKPSRLSAMLGDTATSIDIAAYRRRTAPSRLFSSTRSIPIKGEDLGLIPPPPKSTRTGMSFTCPYCSLILPSHEASSRVDWARHVKNDLDAYVCVFEQCDTPRRLYSTSKEWLSHMANQHRMRWQCLASTHEPSLHETPEDFERHMQTEHAGSFPHKSLPSIINMSAQPIEPVLEHCPFCSHTSGDIEEHVGGHLREYALRSLPPLPEEEWQSSDGSSDTTLSRQRSDKSRRNYLQDLEQDSDDGEAPLFESPVSRSGKSELSGSELSETYVQNWLEIANGIRKQHHEQQDDRDPLLEDLRSQQLAALKRSPNLIDAPPLTINPTRRGSPSHAWDVPTKDSTFESSKRFDHGIRKPVDTHPYTSSLGVPESFKETSNTISYDNTDSGEPRVVHVEEIDFDDDLCSPTARLDLGILDTVERREQLQLHHTQSGVTEAAELWGIEDIDEGPDGVSDTEFELQEKILRALISNKTGEQALEFLPRGALYRIIHVDSVMRKLTEDLSHDYAIGDIRSYAKLICEEVKVSRNGKTKTRSFRKIFALLVLVEMTSSIMNFLQEDVSDLDLPLIPVKKGGKMELRRRDTSGEPSPAALRCFSQKGWSPYKLRNFEKSQWMMLAPFFSKSRDGEARHYLLRDQHILPFVVSGDSENVENIYGGYGKITMVQIHPDHRDFPNKVLCARGFVIKELYESDGDAFKREVKILNKFSGARSHQHIISLLATYEQRSKFHFIFYRAESDLFVYWKEIMPNPTFDNDSILWIAAQCAGIANGLMNIHRHVTFTMSEKDHFHQGAIEKRHHLFAQSPHRPHLHTISSGSMQLDDKWDMPSSPLDTLSMQEQSGEDSHRLAKEQGAPAIQIELFGRHGDINPGNILWFDDDPEVKTAMRGTLQIADFGQAEFNSRLSRSRVRSVANTMTYRPPECDMQPKIINQSYDIWCLGCVYFEFVTWALGGRQLVTRFAEKRLSPDISMDNMRTDTFFEFVKSPDNGEVGVRVKPAVTECFQEVHSHPKCTGYFHDLLSLIQFDMLIVESGNRKTSATVWRALDQMQNKCKDDEEYAVRPNPWSPWKGPIGLVGSSHTTTNLGMTEEAGKTITDNLPLRSASTGPHKRAGDDSE